MDLEELEKLNEQKGTEILSESGKTAPNRHADCSHFGVIKGSFLAFISAFKRWNDFSGRTSRFDFFGFYLIVPFAEILLSLFCFYFALTTGEDGVIISIFLTLAYRIVFHWLGFTLIIRRLHDVNKSGWWILTLIVPACVVWFKGDKNTNLFDEAPKTNEKKANNLIIVTLLCFIIVPLIAGITAGFYFSSKTHETIDEVQTMITKIRTSFADRARYDGLENNHLMYTSGIFTDNMCEDENCENPKNPFGGVISVTPVGNKKDMFSISYSGLPRGVCIKIASADWGDKSSGLQALAVNPQNGSSDTVNSVMPKQIARIACSSRSNVIVWIYK